MNYEEKYKNALERARELSKTVTGANYEYIFPELQESEGERIRKAIIAYISHDQHCGVSNADMIAWLEKQGKQKQTHAELSQQEVTKTSDQEPPDKIEPKKLDADKVIEWLKNTIKERAENYGVYKATRLILPYNSIEDLINDFKEDFGLC